MISNTSNSKRSSTSDFRNKILNPIKGNNRTTLRRYLSDQILNRPPRLILSSFAIVIIIGTILLALPQATTSEEPLSIIDALFTSTSATCVTGLIVVDTGAKFSLFGQIVILTLIQIGGLGIMTFSTFFIFLISGRLGVAQREVLIDTLSQNPTAELTRLLKVVFVYTIIIEAGGWLILTLSFLKHFPLQEAAYQGLFHSVSAFCNAGFSLFSESFMGFQNDAVINIVMVMLIILGGLGFIIILDIYNNRRSFIGKAKPKWSFHSRIVFSSTMLLLFAGMIFFFLLEYSNSLENLPVQGKILASLFQSVTTRTAGFNTTPVEGLTNSTLFLFIILMFIGASPGSCGGGIKTTTFMLVLASIYSRFRMREDVNIFRRRIPNITLSRVISITFFSISIVILFTAVLLIFEQPQLPHTQTRGMFMEVFFEVVSAFGTVGLSTGITPKLSDGGRILITVLMFVGRLGPLTLALAVSGKTTKPKFRYLQEDVMVG